MSGKVIIKGSGAYLPKKIVTNYDLEKTVDTNHDWIVQRTGIEQRHIASQDETTSFMALSAGREALYHAGIAAQELDCIIVATTTPDHTFPSVATQVQAQLKMTHGFAFDVQAVCSGFIYALSVAKAMIETGQAKTILLIGAEKMSSLLDWDDRTTCVLFGDGAGAMVLTRSEEEIDQAGILSCHLHSDGRLKDKLYTKGGPATTQESGFIHMEGREVFKHAVVNLAQIVDEALEANSLEPTDIDWLIPHQANLRIIERTAKKLGLPMEKVITTIQEQGNTSAASVPLAFHSAVQDGKLKRGDLLLLEAMGAGFTWGSALIRY